MLFRYKSPVSAVAGVWIAARKSRTQLCRVAQFASLASMPPPVPQQIRRAIDTLYRAESGRVLATLVRLLGYLDSAEESMHEAFSAALESSEVEGLAV